MQKVLQMTTPHQSLRSDVGGWHCDDSALLVKGKPIGMTPPMPCILYQTPLHALNDGWKLLGPPTSEAINPDQLAYHWWFVRDTHCTSPVQREQKDLASRLLERLP